MEKILVINSGSTSLKYKLYSGEQELKSGRFEDVKDHRLVIKDVLKEIADLRDIVAVGHRVVHGGEKFNQVTKINSEVLKEIENLCDLAPLHNPFSLLAIREVQDYLPEVDQYAVFDTAFFYDLPKHSRLYALPLEIIEKYKIRRYGFHGISHNYALLEAAKKTNINPDKINLITCHLGGGCSMTAIKQGKPIDTSMGFTPLEGLVMNTRAGDIDAGLIFYLIEKMPGYITEEKIKNIYNILNCDSGIKGLSGFSDFRKLLSEYSLGADKAKTAMDVFAYRIIKYIGAYWALLEGKVDAIVFTGAIGSGNPTTRNLILSKLKFLNNVNILSFESNEECMIAKEVMKKISL